MRFDHLFREHKRFIIFKAPLGKYTSGLEIVQRRDRFINEAVQVIPAWQLYADFQEHSVKQGEAFLCHVLRSEGNCVR